MTRILFVDDDPAEILLLKKALAGFAPEWEMAFVRSGRHALDALEQTAFDAVVTDMQMPGMDGAQLLEEVGRRRPETLRIVLSGTVQERDAFRAIGPTHVWLPKPCNAEQLRAIVDRGVAWRSFLSDPRVTRCVGRLKTLPSVPHLYITLVEELRSADTSFRRVAEVIAGDMGMSAKVLKMVNSAFFGFYRHITSLEQAISILGLKLIKALVLSVKVFAEFDSRKLRAFSVEGLMNHSASVASLARIIVKAESRDRNLADDAFVGGLLHDVGKLVLADNLPAEYGRVLAEARAGRVSLCQAEEDEFGATHAEVGAYLLALWGMADPLVAAAAYHHQPVRAMESRFTALTAVHVANALDHSSAPESGVAGAHDVDTDYLAQIRLDDRLEKWAAFCGALTG